MRNDKHFALKLRKEGKSYNAIRDTLNIPKSTLSDWLHACRWSNDVRCALDVVARKESSIKIRKLNKARKKDLESIYKEARLEAWREMNVLKFHPLFIAGVMIYWGEGDRSSKGMVRISNTDLLMVKLFICFLRRMCGVKEEKIRAWLLLYPDLQDGLCRSFWEQHTGLRHRNFNKSVVIIGKHKTKRLRYGVCNVGLTSRYLKEKMLLWLKLLPSCLLRVKAK